jgi:glucokinase
MGKNFIAGFDIGGTKIALALGVPGEKLIARRSFPTGSMRGPNEAMNQALDILQSLALEFDAAPIAAGIGCAGPLNLDLGLVTTSPNLTGWRNFPLRSFVADRLGVPVALDNDANAAAVGEHLYGAGRGFSDLVYFTISTGIGGGIIAGNQLVHRLGEAGHIIVEPGGTLCECGARGCMEALCSGPAIARRAKDQLRSGRSSVLTGMVDDVQKITAETVAEAVRAGDVFALELLEETIAFLSLGVGGIISVLAPQALIFGGGVSSGFGELLLQPLREQLKRQVHIVPVDEIQIVPAALGADSGLYGAIALGARELAGKKVPTL